MDPPWGERHCGRVRELGRAGLIPRVLLAPSLPLPSPYGLRTVRASSGSRQTASDMLQVPGTRGLAVSGDVLVSRSYSPSDSASRANQRKTNEEWEVSGQPRSLLVPLSTVHWPLSTIFTSRCREEMQLVQEPASIDALVLVPLVLTFNVRRPPSPVPRPTSNLQLPTSNLCCSMY